ncbi:hypothetical protein [Frondihabitans sucicola]|uniref:hypothetical protein n=1 Tax=Frondihabitans sucicola TaxID=1268041 RepID=UPI0025731F0F|nr:hypothetical protein [Frondihabitans sucicola]
MTEKKPKAPAAPRSRPWFCIDCGDRFAKNVTKGNHRTEFRPRPTDKPRSDS